MEISGSITSVTDSLSSARLMVVVSIGSDEVVFITGNLFNLKRSPMLKTGFVVSGNSVVVLVTGFLLDPRRVVLVATTSTVPVEIPSFWSTTEVLELVDSELPWLDVSVIFASMIPSLLLWLLPSNVSDGLFGFNAIFLRLLIRAANPLSSFSASVTVGTISSAFGTVTVSGSIAISVPASNLIEVTVVEWVSALVSTTTSLLASRSLFKRLDFFFVVISADGSDVMLAESSAALFFSSVTISVTVTVVTLLASLVRLLSREPRR